MTAAPPTSSTSTDATYRVMIVDDSAVIRSATARVLIGEPMLKVIATATNGQQAIDYLRREPVDVIVLDIEMPIIDGLTALPQLKAIDRGVQIIMSSTLTQKNAEISMQALALGAADYIAKPSAAVELGADIFKQELIRKIKVLGALAHRCGVRSPLLPKVAIQPKAAPAIPPRLINLRKDPIYRPDIIAIGSSTGGPQALFETIKVMGATLPQPIVITQHMAPTFTATLADHIGRQCKVICTEAKNGEILMPGRYYVAPGDYHMTIIKNGKNSLVKLNKEPHENFCRPSVEPMLRSLVNIYGKRILTIILTGMGQDGCSASAAVVKAGGTVIAQDEATSVVWGMPGAVAMAGLCTAVLPIDKIGAFVKQTGMKAAP